MWNWSKDGTKTTGHHISESPTLETKSDFSSEAVFISSPYPHFLMSAFSSQMLCKYLWNG